MKSLEHIIREIREGKTTEKGSKTSLEHSIRKVVKGEKESSFADRTTKPLDEDVGGLIGSGTGGEPKLHAEDGKKKKTDEAIGILGTDDYKGNPKQSFSVKFVQRLSHSRAAAPVNFAPAPVVL